MRTTPGERASFPFMAYEGESQTLVAQGKVAEARGKLGRALTIARANQKRGHEAMILLSLGELALQTGDREGAMKYLEQAGDLSQKYKFYRTVGQAMIDLAELYRDAGDLKSAEERATRGRCQQTRRRQILPSAGSKSFSGPQSPAGVYR